MAKYQKKHLFSENAIKVPRTLNSLMKAFEVDSKRVIKTLIDETEIAIYGSDKSKISRDISKDEFDCIISLMKGINPRDDLEKLYAAQIIICHMLGMRKLTEKYKDDQKIGLDLLKLSDEAIQNLVTKRYRGIHNIEINY